jgi:argininosuccinate lyase
MSSSRHSPPQLYSQVEVSPGAQPRTISSREEQTDLLRDVLNAQERTNELLEDLVATMAAQHKQRASELHQWRNAHPQLATACRDAAEALSRVQIEYLNRMTDDINDQSDDMVEGEFVLNEFVDRYGPRLAHLNGVIQVLAQLSSVPNPTNTQT